jgi:potassium efflux system protein
MGLAVIAAVFLGLPSRGQEPGARAELATAQEPATTTTLPANTPTATSPGLDTATLRAATLEQLKALEPVGAPSDNSTATGTAGPKSSPGSFAGRAKSKLQPVVGTSSAAAVVDPAASKAIKELLRERLQLMGEHDRLSIALSRATHPEPSPERQAAEAKAELERLQSTLAQAAKAPETLLPPAFRGASAKGEAAVTTEMRDALVATTNELKEWKSKVEPLRSPIAKWDGQQSGRRAERDALFQHVTTLKARGKELEAAVKNARANPAGQLARERLVNFEWEGRVESLRLQVVEAEISLEAKLADVRELNIHVCHAHVQIAERTLDQMRARYRTAAEDHERDLKRAAASEESKAQGSNDPLERFRARHTAELLVLEAQVLKLEQALATSPSPSPDEQRSLADHADRDFAQIKGLLDDGRVSRLDAIRLNNDFRRIGPERDRLLRNEMATVETQLQFYEDALTSVELELIQDSLHDRFEQDLMRERVAPAHRSEGESLLNELERKQRRLLVRRRLALEKLSERAAQTLQEVARRLRILEEEYGFIRTHIFWVRDQDPIGLSSLAQGAREFHYMLNGLLRLAQETSRANLWSRPSAEFLATALAVLVLPVALVRLRGVLRRLMQRDLPAADPSR